MRLESVSCLSHRLVSRLSAGDFADQGKRDQAGATLGPEFGGVQCELDLVVIGAHLYGNRRRTRLIPFRSGFRAAGRGTRRIAFSMMPSARMYTVSSAQRRAIRWQWMT